MDIIDILANDSYIIYNKEFAKKYGVEEAIMLGAMCSYQKGFKNEEFYREQEKMLEDTSLTLYALRKAIKSLKDLGILEIRKKGIPAKFYYKINQSRMFELLMSRPCENDRSGGYENDRSSACENESTNNKNKSNKNKNNNYNYIIDYLNEKADVNFRSSAKETQALINARFSDGFEEQDFIKVIDNMVASWKGTELEQYLRPKTLFGTKFESYLNVKQKATNKRTYSKAEMQSMFTDIDDIAAKI